MSKQPAPAKPLPPTLSTTQDENAASDNTSELPSTKDNKLFLLVSSPSVAPTTTKPLLPLHVLDVSSLMSPVTLSSTGATPSTFGKQSVITPHVALIERVIRLSTETKELLGETKQGIEEYGILIQSLRELLLQCVLELKGLKEWTPTTTRTALQLEAKKKRIRKLEKQIADVEKQLIIYEEKKWTAEVAVKNILHDVENTELMIQNFSELLSVTSATAARVVDNYKLAKSIKTDTSSIITANKTIVEEIRTAVKELLENERKQFAAEPKNLSKIMKSAEVDNNSKSDAGEMKSSDTAVAAAPMPKQRNNSKRVSTNNHGNHSKTPHKKVNLKSVADNSIAKHLARKAKAKEKKEAGKRGF